MLGLGITLLVENQWPLMALGNIPECMTMLTTTPGCDPCKYHT